MRSPIGMMITMVLWYSLPTLLDLLVYNFNTTWLSLSIFIAVWCSTWTLVNHGLDCGLTMNIGIIVGLKCACAGCL